MERASARFLDTGARPGAWNMAVDEALLENCRAGLSAEGAGPAGGITLRVYAWSPPALSLGRGQSAARDLRLDRLRAEGVELCRRPTGGRAVLHDREVTYSLIGPESLIGRTIRESYLRVSEGLAAGLRRLGVEAALAPPNGRVYASQPSCFATASVGELSIGGRKVAGSAQCRRGGAVLQHGSVLLHSPEARLARLLRPRRREGPDVPAGRTDHAVGLCESLGREAGYEEVAAALRRGLEEAFSVVFREEPLRASELKRAEELIEERYGNPAWTLSR